MWEIVHLVGFHYKNISRCTVLWMSNSIALSTQTSYVRALTIFETSYNTSNVNISILLRHSVLKFLPLSKEGCRRLLQPLRDLWTSLRRQPCMQLRYNDNWMDKPEVLGEKLSLTKISYALHWERSLATKWLSYGKHWPLSSVYPNFSAMRKYTIRQTVMK